MRTFFRFFLTLFLIAPISLTAHAQDNAAPQNSPAPKQTLRVATRVVPPFVVRDAATRELDGFSIELWQAVGDELGVKSEFVVGRSVKELLQNVRDKKAYAGIAAISITSERDKVFDFSQPMYDSGLQILVRAQQGGSGAPSFWSVLFSRDMGQLALIVLALILVPAHIVWLVERNQSDGIIENKNYFPGIWKALWWSAGTLGAQADEMPKSAFGRFIALLWMFAGIAFVAYFTATITAQMTVSQLSGDIRGPQDLPGKRIATISGSTSANYLRELNLTPSKYSDIGECYKALESGGVQAVVFDAPVLLYYAAREGKGRVQVVGPVFRKENYGIAFPTGSQWRRPVNYALLKLKENGTYDRIYDKWFSDEPAE
jgi:polar amino acid transport system substrate-binding protein